MYEDVLKVNGLHKPCRVVTFDSVWDFSRTKAERSKCVQILEHNVLPRFSDGEQTEWFGAATRKEVEEVLENGHPRYTEMVLRHIAEVPAPRSLVRRKINGDFGDELCIHRVNSGNISSAWKRRTKKERITSANVRLVVNITQAFHIKASQLQWIGVAAIAIAESYEKAGYRVAIDAVVGATGVSDKENILMVVPVKTYEEPMDVQSLSSTVCFPAFFRWSGFMNMGLADGEIDSGLGSPMNNETVLDKIIRPHFAAPVEIIEGISNQCLSEEAAQAEIVRIVGKSFERLAA